VCACVLRVFCVCFARVRACGVRVCFACVRACGVRGCVAGVRACGVRACGVRACGVRACGVRTSGVRACGVRVCGVRTCGVRVWYMLGVSPHLNPNMEPFDDTPAAVGAAATGVTVPTSAVFLFFFPLPSAT
jgi:hypothetical protein